MSMIIKKEKERGNEFFTHFKEKKTTITLNSYQKGSLLGLEELIHNMKCYKSSIKCASASGQILSISHDLFLNVFYNRKKLRTQVKYILKLQTQQIEIHLKKALNVYHQNEKILTSQTKSQKT